MYKYKQIYRLFYENFKIDPFCCNIGNEMT